MVLGLALALWLAFVVRSIWLPLFLALLIAMVLDPLVDRMETRGWTRLRAAIVIYSAFFIVMGTVLTLAVPAVINQTTEIVKSVGQYLPGENETQTKHSLKLLLKKLKASPFVENSILRASAQITSGVHNLSVYVGEMAQGVVVNLLWVVLIPILSFYALKDFHILYARFLLLVPKENRSLVQHITNEITTIFVRYLQGILIVCALNAVATTLLLTVLGVPNPLGLGAISGLLYMVPYLGATLTVLLIAAVSLMSQSAQMMLVVVACIFVLHNVIFDYVITPRIVGHNVGLHPMNSILALLIGGAVLGIVGMILAVPIAATVQRIVMTIFPKLSQPIEIPVGAELHTRILENKSDTNTEGEIETAMDVHQTIMDAVDLSEEQNSELTPQPPSLQTSA